MFDGRDEAILERRLRMHHPLKDILRVKKRRETDMTGAGEAAWQALLKTALPLPIWVPCSPAQLLAFESRADLMLLGGSVGSGKTNCALGIALVRHERVRVERKTKEAAGAIVKDLLQFTRHDDRRNDGKGEWVLDDPKTRLVQVHWNGLSTDTDFGNTIGNPTDLRIIDEVSQVAEKYARDGVAWVRTTTPGQRCASIWTTNPDDTARAYWLVKMFAPWIDPDYKGVPAKDGELRFFITNPFTLEEIEVEEGTERTFEDERRGTQTVRASSRTFIGLSTADNFFLTDLEGYQSRMAATMTAAGFRRFLKGSFHERAEDPPDQIIPTDWCKRAQDRWHPGGWRDAGMYVTDRPYMCAVGADIAGGTLGRGKDRNVIVARWGGWFAEPVILALDEIAGKRIASRILDVRKNNCPVYLDAGGGGARVYERLTESIPDRVEGVVFNSPSHGEMDVNKMFEFKNMRSYLWWRFREALDPDNERQVMIPPDGEILDEFTRPRYQDEGGTLVVESKKRMREQYNRSTDIADAIIMAAVGWACPHRGIMQWRLAEKYVRPSLSGAPTGRIVLHPDDDGDISPEREFRRGVPSRQRLHPVFGRGGRPRTWMG